MLSYVSSSQAVMLGLTLALKSLLLCVVLYRQIFRDYPIFVTWCAVACGKSWFLYWCLHHYSVDQYFVAYWHARTAYEMATLCCVFELLARVFFTSTWFRLPEPILSHQLMCKFATFGLLLTFVICAFHHMQKVHPSAILTFYVTIDRICADVSCGMLGLSLLWSSYFSLKWRRHQRAIAYGFIALLFSSVIVIPAGQYFLSLTRTVSIAFSMTAEIGILCCWLRCFWVIREEVSGGRQAELLQLLDRGKALEQEAEKLTGSY